MNRNLGVCRYSIVALGIIFIFILGTARAGDCFSSPFACTTNGDIDPATKSTYADRSLAYANLAWSDFLYLNFPADTDSTGKLLPQPSAKNGLNYKGGDYVAVWQVWPAARDVFLPKGAAPGAFGVTQTMPAMCIKATEGKIESETVLDEYIQANRMGPVIDKNGEYVRYGINFNKEMFDYIVKRKLYSADGQLDFDKNNPNREKSLVQFPHGIFGQGNSEAGSIFVKSSWKILGAYDDEKKFFRTKAYVYQAAGGAFSDEPSVKEQCALKTVGLVGLHIVHLTNSAPQWVWATFEHRDNAPWISELPATSAATRSYSFFDPAKCLTEGKLSCAYNTLPPQPWNPEVKGQTPAELIRLAQPGEFAQVATATIKKKLQAAYGETVWDNYFLADIQFPTVTRSVDSVHGAADVNPAYPAGMPAASFLANSTMETYIQGFSAGQTTSNGDLVPVWDQMQAVQGEAAGSTVFHNIAGGAARVTSSCIGCHADASMTTGSSAHFVFSLDRAQKASPPVMHTRAEGSPAVPALTSSEIHQAMQLMSGRSDK